MPDWIVKYWVQWLFGIVIVLLSNFATWLFSKIKKDKKIEALHKEIETLQDNHKELQTNYTEVKDLLEKLVAANNVNQYEKLYYLHKKYMKIGYISIDDMRNVRSLYESYHLLGGNGHGTALYKDLEELPSYPHKEKEKTNEE